MLDRIGDKWTVLVVLLLSDGPMRFSELRSRLGRVAPKVLTQTLRRMERDGLVTREIFAEVPPRVEYALTGLGSSLIEPIAVIGDWAEVNVDRITAAQAAYDAVGNDSRAGACRSAGGVALAAEAAALRSGHDKAWNSSPPGLISRQTSGQSGGSGIEPRKGAAAACRVPVPRGDPQHPAAGSQHLDPFGRANTPQPGRQHLPQTAPPAPAPGQTGASWRQ